jgi:prepilin-type N-terminal cleavage/methylation domain-containing protein
MKRTEGFTLIELLVVIAIIGILGAVGVVAFLGYISGAKEKQATTGLSSIYLAQEEYRSMMGTYYQSSANCGSTSDDSTVINNNLFNADTILESENYNFCIEYLSGTLTYQANAYLQDGSGVYLTIANTNLKRKFNGSSWQESW